MRKNNIASVTAEERAMIGKKSATIGILSNIALFVAKLSIGIFSGAVSIVADALNNLSDVSSAVVSFVGFKLSEKPADAEHPYGHARSEYIAGTVIATTILFIGLELLKTSVGRIIEPKEVKCSLWVVLVLLLSIGVKGFLYFYNKKTAKRINSTALSATAADSRNDVLATTAVLISTLTDALTDINCDGFVGALVALFIMYSGVELMKETVNPLLGMAANPVLRDEITSVVCRKRKVIGCHDLLVHDYGPKQCFASIHIEMDKNNDVMECHEIIDDIERECLERLGVHLVAHFDPVITGDERIEHLRTCVTEILKAFDERLCMHDFRMVQEEEGTKLIFDVMLPDSLRGRKGKIQQYVNEELSKKEGEGYYSFITFDLMEN